MSGSRESSVPHGSGGAGFSFDSQAADFDRRAGLPAQAALRIAAVIEEITTQNHQDSRSHLLLDVGAGTGELGVLLARGPWRYVGVDVSAAMLAVFRRKLPLRWWRTALVRADAELGWPIRSGRAEVIFLSRAAHLFASEHLAAEVLRVARPAGWVILGSVRREPQSLRAALRVEMQRRLAHYGVPGRSGRNARDQLCAALAAQGGRLRAPQTAASWSVAERAADALTAWRTKPGLAGRALDPELQRRVLDELKEWATAQWGDLSVPRSAQERYELLAIQLPAASAVPRRGRT